MRLKGIFGSRVGGDVPKVVETQPETGIWAFIPNTSDAALQNPSSAVTEGLLDSPKGRAGMWERWEGGCVYT